MSYALTTMAKIWHNDITTASSVLDIHHLVIDLDYEDLHIGMAELRGGIFRIWPMAYTYDGK